MMAIGNGHQAIEPAPFAVIRQDPAIVAHVFAEIRSFPAACVNTPDGMKSLDWIDRGFPGAKC